jgi:hypothetical protein
VNIRRYLGLALAVVMSVVTGLLIADSSAATPTPAAGASESPAESAVVTDQQPARWITPKASNVPLTKLTPGAKAPQFVIFSFDGAGSHEKLTDFLAVAKPTDSRMVGFLSGTYLLTDDNNDAYRPPGVEPGTSSIGFGGGADEVRQRVADLNTFYELGNEIGTHYNGHFCAQGANWSTADWNSELDQFFGFFNDWKASNSGLSGPEFRVPATAVKGGRTPCLAGKFDQLTPSWKQHGMTYDSSGENSFTGIAWPRREDGIWQFPIPTVYSPAYVAAGFKPLVKAMDYNFWVKFNNAKEQPATQPKVTRMVLDTYRFMYEQAYRGNRAPILIANHFNDWNGNSFNPAVRDFMAETCGRPETICATYQDVIAWMEFQDPEVLASLQELPPVADVAPKPN